MPPQSRGQQRPINLQSRSSPNLTTLRSLTTRQPRERDDTSSNGSVEPFPFHDEAKAAEVAAHSSEEDIDEDDIATEDDEEDEEEDDTRPLSVRGREGLYATRSHPHLPPSSSQLFPPFYNRPPTPLPPSPSLTSLLRPSFSTHTSHHTTPESSDTESAPGGSRPLGHTASSSTASAAVPPRAAHPKVPTYEYYGFALYLSSTAFFLTYLLWSYLPSPFLHQLGIHYYPNRWWALAIPCWLVMLLVWIYVALASYNTGTLTLPMKSIENCVDAAAQVAVLDSEGRIIRRGRGSRFRGGSHGGKAGRGHKKEGSGGGGAGTSSVTGAKASYVPAKLGRDVNWQALWNEGTDAVMDVPLGGVCEILYGEGRMRAEDDEDDENSTERHLSRRLTADERIEEIDLQH